MRLIHPDATHTTSETVERGRVIRTEHFNGSVDAEVKLRALRFNVVADAPPDQRLVYAIHELEEATKEYRLAQHAGNPGWLTYSTGRMAEAKRKVRELQ